MSDHILKICHTLKWNFGIQSFLNKHKTRWKLVTITPPSMCVHLCAYGDHYLTFHTNFNCSLNLGSNVTILSLLMDLRTKKLYVNMCSLYNGPYFDVCYECLKSRSKMLNLTTRKSKSWLITTMPLAMFATSKVHWTKFLFIDGEQDYRVWFARLVNDSQFIVLELHTDLVYECICRTMWPPHR